MPGLTGAQVGTKIEDRAWKRDIALWLGILMAFAATLPVLVAWAPQMTDYPSHLAAHRIMLEHGVNPFLTKYYAFQWKWTGNLGANLLMVPLTPLLGLEAASKFITWTIPLLTGLSFLAVGWALRGRIGIGVLLAFLTIWSPSLLMGFINYSLSLALAMFAFAAWVRWEGWRWRTLAMVPIGFIVWLAHVSGWGVLGVLVFGYEWSRRKNFWSCIVPWPLALPLIPMLLTASGGSKIGYGRQVFEYKWSIIYRALRSHVEWFDIATLAFVAALLAVAALTRRLDGRLGWAALVLFILTLAVPRHIFGGDYADYRLSTAALMVACLAIKWPAPRWSIILVASLFFVRIGITTQSWYEDGRISQDMIRALEHVPEGATVATAVAIPRRQWEFGPFEHFGSYAVVRRSAKENSNFALPGVHLLSMAEPDSRRFADPSQRILYAPWQKIDLRKFRPAKQADYLWYIGTVEPAAVPEGAHILFRTPNSFLARLANPPKSS